MTIEAHIAWVFLSKDRGDMFLEADRSMVVNKRQAANGGDKLYVFGEIETQVLADGRCPCLSQMDLSPQKQLKLTDELRVIEASFMCKGEVLEE